MTDSDYARYSRCSLRFACSHLHSPGKKRHAHDPPSIRPRDLSPDKVTLSREREEPRACGRDLSRSKAAGVNKVALFSLVYAV